MITVFEEIPEVARRGLQRALDGTTFGEFWDIPSAQEGLTGGSLGGFHQVESGYSGIFTIRFTPLSKQLYFFWSGKDELNDTPIDFDEVDDFLQSIAKACQCTHIYCEGRIGWKKIIEPLGYILESHSYIRGTNNGQ